MMAVSVSAPAASNFGVERKSDAQLIMDMLSKLPQSRRVTQQHQQSPKHMQQHSPQGYQYKGYQQQGHFSAPPGLDMVRPPMAFDSMQLPVCGAPPGLEHVRVQSSCGFAQSSSEDDLSTFAVTTRTPFSSSASSVGSTGGSSPRCEAAAAPLGPQPAPQVQSSCCTTLMVRNIPPFYTKEMLLGEWSGSSRFDFLYLPRNKTGDASMGFAFINFVTCEEADKFRARWHKVRLSRSSARKILNVSSADVQGFTANLRLSSKFRDAAEAPLVFQNGKRVSLEHCLAATGETSTNFF